jgi:hypothetical protein
MGAFHFETLFNTAVNDIDAGGVISSVNAGNFLLLASLLFSMFENWRAQDVGALGSAAVRYFVATAILAVYTPAF